MSRIIEGANRANAEEAASFVDKFEAMEAEIATERGTFMAKVKAIRERQGELLEDAKSQGVAKKTVKAIVKARELELKARGLLADLDDDARDYAVDIRKALGDDFSTLPLGAAAIERADDGKKDDADRTPEIVAHTMKEWARQDAANQ